jgi:hypothetical protein
MGRLANLQPLVWPSLGGLFAAIFAAFLTMVLNPQMPITTGDHFRLLGTFLLGVGLPSCLLLLLLGAALPRRRFLLFFLLCFLVTASLPLERALHPLFLHPALIKILYKGAYAGAVLLVGFLLLRRHPLLIFLLVGVASAFLYHRRDAFQAPGGAVFSGHARGAVPTRHTLLLADGYAADEFWDDLKGGCLPGVEALQRRGVTGTFRVRSYFTRPALGTTLLTGTWPYQHRVFGEGGKAPFPVRGADRFPFWFPQRGGGAERPAVPMLWDILTAQGVSCGIVDFPIFDPEGSAVTFFRWRDQSRPPSRREEELHAIPVSFLLHALEMPLPQAPALERAVERARLAMRPEATLGVVVVPAGVLVLAGPGIRGGSRATSMRAVDLVPTLTYLFQVPLSAQMPGRILLEAFEPEWITAHPMGVVGRY